MPSLRDAAAEAFAAGWTLTGAPLTPAYSAAAQAAITLALDIPDDPAILEVTLKIGSLTGAWAKVFDRRERLTAEHTAIILAIWRKILPHLKLRDLIARWWRTASILAADGRKDATRAEATQAARGWLNGVYGADAYPKLEAELADALAASMAEGKAGMLAVAAEQHDQAGFPVDTAYKDYYAQLKDLSDLPLMAQQWIERMIGSSAADVGRTLANLAADDASPDGMAAAVGDLLGSEDTGAVVLFTDQAIGQAMTQAALSLYQDEGLTTYNFVTAGDERVCEKCLADEAQGPYRLGMGPIPPEHPRCRCAVTPTDPLPISALAPFLDLIP